MPETIELEVRTSTANGLLLWQGVVSAGVRPGLRVPSLLVARAVRARRAEATAGGASAVQTGNPSDPVLPWQDVGEAGRGKDFISLGLQDGHLVFRWVRAPGPSSPSLAPHTPPELPLCSVPRLLP